MEKRDKSLSPHHGNKIYFRYQLQPTNEIQDKLINIQIEPQDNKINEKTTGSILNNQNLQNSYKINQSNIKKKNFQKSNFQHTQKETLKSSLKEIIRNESQQIKTQENGQYLLKFEDQDWKYSQIFENHQNNRDPYQLEPFMSPSILHNIHYNRDQIDKNGINQLEPQAKDTIQKPIPQKGENKRQKKGLASISLKVKNIVLEHKKLTYKQVSDLVLDSCAEQISKLNEKDKQKEIKNIRRRVYDALNVLVSVDILGKQKRHVVLTEWTNFQGKKLTNQWNQIRSQQQEISSRQKICYQKQKNLSQAINKYKSVLALRKRNQQRLQKKAQSQKFKQIQFPFIIIPRNNFPISIQIQKEQVLETVIIRGKNINLITDVDVVTKLELPNIQTDMTQILNQIDSIKKSQNL